MDTEINELVGSNNDLELIRDTVQHVVSAISAVLGVEVAVIDNHFELIATSKTFLETRGTSVNVDFIKAVYRKGVAVIPNPGLHEYCVGCKYEGICPETAEVLRVIEHDGKRFGVILLVAYTTSQKEKLLDNTSELLEFISEMTNLLYDEILLQKSLQAEKLLKRQFETTMEFVDTGIITIDRKGHIKQINSKAKKILCLSNSEHQGLLLKELLPDQLVDQLINKGSKIRRCEVQIAPPREVHCLVSANPIAVSGKLMGAVLRVSDFKDVASTVYEFSSQYIETTFEDILGNSSSINFAKIQASKVAKGDSTVLIQGESGTGKELFARAIHSNSPRQNRPFIALNCAAIPETLLESELFGYDDGAFTGARKSGKPGKFEMASGGTLFLDEIGDMPLHMQAKIIRVLQEGVIERLGSLKTSKVDVRIIAATHRKLEQLVKEGSFREDLFYRLNVVPIFVPALRERKQDILVLLDYFLAQYNGKMERRLTGFSDDVIDIFKTYHWPGNVRELQNAVEYAVNIETGEFISKSSIPTTILHKSMPKRQEKPLAEKVREYESLLIKEAFKEFENSVDGKKLAAKKLGISLPTLYRKIKEFGV
jgi:transcriptional regulator with PAS, ATPase and Fis domain